MQNNTKFFIMDKISFTGYEWYLIKNAVSYYADLHHDDNELHSLFIRLSNFCDRMYI